MEMNQAVDCLGALASSPRLSVFRLLVRAGTEGMRAGEVADAIAAPASTTSNHLAVLCRAGLIASRREGRNMIYFANYPGVAGLISYLVEDCCSRRPEICGTVAAEAQRAICAEPQA